MKRHVTRQWGRFSEHLGCLMVCLEGSLTPLAVCCGVLGVASVACAAEDASPEAAPADTAGDALQEVTVTATRRTETLQNVPYNIAAIGGDAIAKSGVTSINNLTQLVPGLQSMDTGPDTRGGNNQFSMRGLRTDSPGGQLDNARSGSIAPVSTYLGDTPIFFPLELKDLARVEVLKGPQGTLYGSGALAGTIRFIPNRPEFDSFHASADASASGTEYSGQPNGSFDGMLNAPLRDDLALRVVGGYERLGGFVDAVDLAQRSIPGVSISPPVPSVPGDPHSGYTLAPVMQDTNWSERWYVRSALRWKPSAAIDTELSYLHQRVGVGDSQISNTGYPGGPFQFDDISGDPNAVIRYRPGGAYRHTADTLQPSQRSLDLAALAVTADLGFASLTSNSSVYRTKSREALGYVGAYFLYNADGSVARNYYDYYSNYARGNAQNLDRQRDQSFIQEVRLVSTWHEPIDYILGLYYQAEHFNFLGLTYEPGYTDYVTAAAIPGALPRPYGDLFYLQPMDQNGFRFEDRAVFGELTWHITPQWQVTGGARLFHQDFTNLGLAYDTYYAGDPAVDVDVANHNAVTSHILKFNTSYDFTPDFKVYATYSEGFRRGGANGSPLAGNFAVLPSLLDYTPDKSKNHEIGVKGRLFDGLARYTADIFFIKLDKFQFDSYTGSGFPAVFNGTEARSKGAEFDSEFRITPQLSTSLSYAYTEATVARGFTIQDYANEALVLDPTNPPLVTVADIRSGARLPVTPRHSASVAVNYTIPLGEAAVQLHADLAYRSSAPAYIDANSPNYWVIPASHVTNTRFSYDSGQRWSADLFINNLTNEVVYSGAYGPVQTVPNVLQERYVGRPRTFGLSLHYKW